MIAVNYILLMQHKYDRRISFIKIQFVSLNNLSVFLYILIVNLLLHRHSNERQSLTLSRSKKERDHGRCQNIV